MTKPTSRAPSVFATYLRGGTSKALFFHEHDIPPPGQARDKFIIRVMGSPNPSQIDGMGGTRIVTSKAAIIRPSTRPDADIDYTFAQIGLGAATVDYEGNCGNISSGVGPFAINEDLLEDDIRDDEGKRVVRIYNTGQQALLVAHVPVDNETGRALEKGDYAISGVDGTGAPIDMDYSQTAKPDSVLPTGNVIDTLECTFGTIDATYCEVGNPVVFVDAAKLGIQGNESAVALDSDRDLIKRVFEVRGRMAQKLGKCDDWQKVDAQSPMVPMVALLSKPSDGGDIQSRMFLDNHVHPSMAGTVSVCTATVSRIRGSVAYRLLSKEGIESDIARIQHPSGVIPVFTVAKYESRDAKLPVYSKLAFVRTARYIFQGNLFIPVDIEQDVSELVKRSLQ